MTDSQTNTGFIPRVTAALAKPKPKADPLSAAKARAIAALQRAISGYIFGVNELSAETAIPVAALDTFARTAEGLSLAELQALTPYVISGTALSDEWTFGNGPTVQRNTRPTPVRPSTGTPADLWSVTNDRLAFDGVVTLDSATLWTADALNSHSARVARPHEAMRFESNGPIVATRDAAEFWCLSFARVENSPNGFDYIERIRGGVFYEGDGEARIERFALPQHGTAGNLSRRWLAANCQKVARFLCADSALAPDFKLPVGTQPPRRVTIAHVELALEKIRAAVKGDITIAADPVAAVLAIYARHAVHWI